MLAHDLFLQNQVSKQNWQTDTSQAPEDFFFFKSISDGMSPSNHIPTR